MDAKTPDIWYLIFEQTPPVLRWAFGLLTFGFFTLAGVIYKSNQVALDELHRRIDRLENRISKQNVETNRLLFQIACNTGMAPNTGEVSSETQT